MGFTHKVVVITGAASGLGAEIALSFAKLNATLCIIDKSEKNLAKTKEACEKESQGKVLEVVADLIKDEDVERAVETALMELGKINVLVNCAGVAGAGSLHDADIVKKIDKVMSINLRATIVMTRQALPALIKSKGCVINISSVLVNKMVTNMIGYSISKAGVTNFTKCAAFELANHGVRVNCISPGPVRTNIWLNAGMNDVENHTFWNEMAGMMPLKKCVKVEEIAELILYLASDKAASITGSDFVIDAGMQLGHDKNESFSR